MRFLLMNLLFLTACSHLSYRQQLLAGGKTWELQIDASGYSLAQINDKIRIRANNLCGSDSYRLFAWEITDRYFKGYIECAENSQN